MHCTRRQIWDARRATEPVIHLAAAHSHWVWAVKFHPQVNERSG